MRRVLEVEAGGVAEGEKEHERPVGARNVGLRPLTHRLGVAGLGGCELDLRLLERRARRVESRTLRIAFGAVISALISAGGMGVLAASAASRLRAEDDDLRALLRLLNVGEDLLERGLALGRRRRRVEQARPLLALRETLHN